MSAQHRSRRTVGNALWSWRLKPCGSIGLLYNSERPWLCIVLYHQCSWLCPQWTGYQLERIYQRYKLIIDENLRSSIEHAFIVHVIPSLLHQHVLQSSGTTCLGAYHLPLCIHPRQCINYLLLIQLFVFTIAVLFSFISTFLESFISNKSITFVSIEIILLITNYK